MALEAAAALSLENGDPTRALRLCGAAHSLRESYTRHGIYLPKGAKERADPTTATARERSGGTAADSVWEAGRHLRPGQALAEVLNP